MQRQSHHTLHIPSGNGFYPEADVARRTPYFEQILSGMQNQGGGQNVTVNNVIEARAFKRTRKLLMKIFPQGSGIRRTLGKMYWRILDK